MKSFQKNKREQILLADMHGNGVYFDRKVLHARRLKIQPDGMKGKKAKA